MKKKLFGYLTLAFAIMSIGLVGSCRDYDEDVFRVKQELKDADSDLYDTIIKRYNWSLDSLRALRTDVNAKFDDINSTLEEMDSTMQALAKRDSVINDSLQKLYQQTKQADADLNDRVDSVAQVLDSLNHVVDSLVNLNHHNPYDDSLLLANDSILSALIDSLAALNHHDPYDDSLLSALIDSLANLNHHDPYDDSLLLKHDTILFDSIESFYNHFLIIDSTLTAIQDTLDSVLVLVDTLNNRVNRLMDQVNDLMNAENKRITSLYVQGALNPTFGYFALPGGIKNNILMGYYGEAAYDAEFPAIDGTSPSSALIYDTPSAYMLSATEAANIGTVTPISLAAGDVIPANNDTVALGKIYLTVNPNEVEIDSTYTFKFVNSIGEESKATIGELTHSSDKLQFGFRTRGASTDSTGFYEAPVTVLANDVESIKPEISVDPAQLKAVVKKLMNKQIDLGGIAGAVFDLFQTKLDAQAVKTTWTDSLGTHNITSYYDVAATAVKPLSFSAMNGMGAGISIPTISPIGDLSTFVPTFVMPDLGDFDITGVTITIPSITFTSLGNVIVEFSNPSLGTQSADLTDLGTKLAGELAGFTDATQTEINSEINAMIAQINLWVTNKLNKIEINMDAGVNGMLDDLKNNINSAFSGYISKLNSITGRINSMINRLNSVLSTSGAGAILQPILVYEGVDGNMHPVSNDAAHPSVANGAVGKQMILYPTSYSAELLAPAYKKYIAIVDVTDGGTMTTSTNSNCGSYFNQVIDGGRYGIDFKPEAAGTYVIYYSAIDYNGRIAANRFYIKVQ